MGIGRMTKAKRGRAKDTANMKSSYDDWTMKQLTAECVKRNIDKAGMRQTLIDRLNHDDTKPDEESSKKKQKVVAKQKCVWTLCYRKWTSKKKPKRTKKKSDINSDDEEDQPTVVYFQQMYMDPKLNEASFHIMQKHSVRKTGKDTYRTVQSSKEKQIDWLVSAADEDGKAMACNLMLCHTR